MQTPTNAPPDEFTTSDLGTAAFVVAKDFPLLRVDRSDTRVRFVFPGGAKVVADLYALPGRAVVDARRFHFALRELRSLTRPEGWR